MGKDYEHNTVYRSAIAVRAMRLRMDATDMRDLVDHLRNQPSWKTIAEDEMQQAHDALEEALAKVKESLSVFQSLSRTEQ